MSQVNISLTPDGNIIANSWPTADGAPQVYNAGDIAWVLASTALVWIMIPGVGFFYSGLLRRKNALSTIYLSMAILAVISFQWFFWGFSLAFSETASPFIGDLKYIVLRNVLDGPSIGSTRIPSSVYMIYQCMFAAITPVLLMGGFVERARLGPILVYVFIWATIVYDPIACWTWNSQGWSFKKGILDFAGGGPVHMASASGALAVSLYLGKRRGYGTEVLAYRPHNVTYVILGTAMLWFGWFGFNGGSALSANLRAVSACIVTNLAASVGGITWLLLDWRAERKWSAVGFCSGAVSGLVGITPASGYVGAPAAVAIGFVTAFACNYGTKLKFLLRIDDALDIFASHGIGGAVGCLLTGLFAQASIASLDGVTVIPGGWINHNYILFPYQIANCVAIIGYSFVVSFIICWIMHFIPGLRLRCDEETEIVGIDDAEMGEFAYDYVALDPEARMSHFTADTTVSAREPGATEGALNSSSGGSIDEKSPKPVVGDAVNIV